MDRGDWPPTANGVARWDLATNPPPGERPTPDDRQGAQEAKPWRGSPPLSGHCPQSWQILESAV